MKKLLTPAFVSLALVSCGNSATLTPYDYADPMVGTGYHGHTFPGAATPFGGVQLSPDTRAENWDACSGYHYSDSTLDGFSHTHLSGTGCCDLGDIFVRPTSRTVNLKADTLYYASKFTHANEEARPGYYSVHLDDEDIFAELTATPHAGVHRYTFPEDSEINIIFDLDHTLSGEDIDEASISIAGENEMAGTRVTYGWTPDHHVYFAAKFSQPFKSAEIIRDGHAAVLSFSNEGKPLTFAVALSGVSRENAFLNLREEVADLDFDKAEGEARKMWSEALSSITVEGGTPDQKKNFYTSLYHAMLAPNLMSDVNGQYRRHNHEIATTEGKYYSTLSLWDTYRTWNPLMTIINRELVCDIINSMLDMYDATGELPLWPLASGETQCMIGRHSVSVIADSYLKGIRCFDAGKALDAMIDSSNKKRKGGLLYAANGYIPCDSVGESVSCTIEYSYDDWCVARMAEAMGRKDVAGEYYVRAKNYANLYDSSTGFFRGRNADGSWKEPFNPAAVNHDMTEATAWQYRFGAAHDVEGMIRLYGGTNNFASAIDSMFTTDAAVEGELSDITGLMGQYAHGNEPSHHVACLYNYAGQPWKTQAMTRRLLDEMYSPTPEGICGNEDCGQMSAWYIMTSLGLYPVAPGDNRLALTTPLFEKAVISLPDGNKLTILANEPSKNVYIESVMLNGKTIDDNFIDFSELMKGGQLKFTLTDKPNLKRGSKTPLNVMSFNIRYDNPEDGVNNWKYRRDSAAEAIKSSGADIVGTQEVLHNQLMDFKERLPEYEAIGVARDDGKTIGEYNVLFYKRARFEHLASGTFWLSETPEEPSRGWDGACNRVATWARLKDKDSGKEFLALNTHLDHVGEVARREGISLIFTRLEELGKDVPVIVTGDFNSTPDSDVVSHITNPTDPNHLTDSRAVAGVVNGPDWSWHDFGRLPLENRPLIDYVFIRGGITIETYSLLSDAALYDIRSTGDSDVSPYLSDHSPLLVTMTLD